MYSYEEKQAKWIKLDSHTFAESQLLKHERVLVEVIVSIRPAPKEFEKNKAG